MVRLVTAGQGLARVVLVSLSVVICGAVVGAGPAAASVSRFGGEGSGAGQFSEPQGIAVEQESGAVYVVDRNNRRIEKFGAEGELLLAWGWGVADGHTQAPQTCTSVCFAGLEGSGSGQFASPEGAAVDNDPLSPSYRDVYVMDGGNRRVEKFDSTGNFLLMFGGEVNATTHGNVCLAGETCQAGVEGSGPGQFEPNSSEHIAVDAAGTVLVGDENRVEEFGSGGIYEGQIALPGAGLVTWLAVDSSGDVYVTASELSGVRKFDGGGVELGEPRDASGVPNALAVGPADELFVNDGVEGSHHILEFDPAGSEIASFDAGTESGYRGIAFGDGIGELYVLNHGAVRLVSVPAAGPLLVAGSDAASQLQPTTATLGATINPEGHETSYHFEYGTSSAYGTSTPSATLEGNFEEQPASAGLSGLQPRTTYHFRVVASNSAGTMFGPDETFATLPPALIDSESVSDVTSTGATLAAQLNPLGRDTAYRFEYGPSTAYGTSVPVPDGDAGSGTSDVSLSALVEHLAPGTVYHYRIVASNSLGTVDGPDRAFTTGSGQASRLPDGRAWEMVSPPDKHGAALEAIGAAGGGLIQAARDGSAISYIAGAPVDAEPAGNRSFVFTQVLSTRGSGGWSSRGIATANERPAGFGNFSTAEYDLFTEDLSVGLVQPGGDTPLSPTASEETPYRREANGDFTPLVTAANVLPGTHFGGAGGAESSRGVLFAGASPDLAHVVVSSPQALTPGSGVGQDPGHLFHNLYEWVDGSLQVASVLPNERPVTAEGVSTSELGSSGNDVRHAVSDDGSRIVWTSGGQVGPHLYVRDMRLGQTVRLDVVEEGAQSGNEQLRFQTASSDGSKVFFVDAARLTADATGENDLYMCEVGIVAGRLTCKLTDLTVDEHAGEAADVRGEAIGAGEDGRYIYFAAGGALAPGAVPGSCHLKRSEDGYVPGAVCNLYVYDTVAGVRKLVAVLSNEDAGDWQEKIAGSGQIATLTARVSPNGRYLAFMSHRSLTGYDNIDARSGMPDEEVFLYDVSTGRVVCVSCNPTGARPDGLFDPDRFPGLLVDRPGSWAEQWLAASLPGWSGEYGYGHNYYQSRYLSDSGRLFFDAADALVPGDINGTEDVYEYEPGGVGGCSGGAGCVGLISSGTSGEESAFIDASASGEDVFFLTSSRLVGQDIDSSRDVYDARVCTASSPCVQSGTVSVPVCSSGEACRTPAPPQPGVFAAASSMSVSGVGNLAPPTGGVVKRRSLTKAQKLAGALRVCRKKPRRKRVLCEARARRLYGSGVKAKHRGAGATRKGKG